MILPSAIAINEIYGQMLMGRFANVSDNFSKLITNLPDVSVSLWNWMRTKMLPSPSKFHYVFNLRELSRVFQGVLRTPRSSVTNGKTLVLLWRHECDRVFSDKLTTISDKANFTEQLNIHTKMLLEHAALGTAPGMSPKVSDTKTKGKAPPPATPTKKSAASSKLVPGKSDEDSNITYEDVAEESFWVDFLRDDVLDEDGALVATAPKIYEKGTNLFINILIFFFFR